MAFWNEPLIGTYLYILPKDIRDLIKPLAPVHTYLWSVMRMHSSRRYLFCPICFNMCNDMEYDDDRMCGNYPLPPIKTISLYSDINNIRKYNRQISEKLTGQGYLYRVIFD